MSGPDMLLKAAIAAFVPKETAAQITAAIEGMIADGSLAGIGTLVSDIAEIKRGIARLEFENARIFAALQSGQQIFEIGTGDDVYGSRDCRPIASVAAIDGPNAIREPGNGGSADREPDGVRG